MVDSIERRPVNVMYNPSGKEFIENIQTQRRPCIIRNVDIGDCVKKWTPEYLSKHGGSKPVKIHVSEVPQMNFVNKNYLYKTLPFSELVKRCNEKSHSDFYISSSEYYYLRSIGDNARKDVANFHNQFPNLAHDLKIPNYFSKEEYFSSVLRLASANLQLWTHYDMMDNILIQVQGKKRIVLFHPNETENLYLNGDKSKVMDIDNPDLEKYPKFLNATQHEAILNPGDIIFIPALWYHNVVALEVGVAVNVFWKNLDLNLYDNKDPYGNKDLIPASRALESLKKSLKLFENLPSQYRDFYGQRMVGLIKESLYNNDNL